MLDWLKRFLESAAGLIPAPVTSAIQWSLEAIGGLFGSITFNVSDAWRDLTGGLDAMRAGLADFASDVAGKLEQIVAHWIPRYAITAWWWVTHPLELADRLTLYVVHWLEVRAWQIAPYLGKFVLALLVHNIRRVLALAEEVITAIL